VLAALAPACGGTEAIACGDAVLVDWNNGRLDSTQAPQCYRDALEDLPEDARLYTSATEDIKRALRQSLAAQASRRQSETTPRAAPSAGEPSRQLSGRQRERSAGGEAATSARPAPGALNAPTRLPLPVVFTVSLVLLVGAGAATGAAARRLRVRRLVGRSVPPDS
jgi:hypothetical protein